MNSEADDYSSNTKRLHFLLVPLMEQGHMIPMIDLARLLATRDILVTFATTPVNLSRIQPIVDRAAASALPIRFVELHFPVADVGLPDGCESVDLLPSTELILPFLNALPLLRDPLEAHLRISDPFGWPKPVCLISDNQQHWTADVARCLNIPRLIFHGPSCFFLYCNLLINRHRAELEAALEASSGGSIMLPDLPHPIRVSNREVSAVFSSDPDWSKYMETIRVAEESADGVLVNSFVELEPWYFERYGEATGKPVWPVGPLSLYKEEIEVKAARGRVSSIDNNLLFQWLDKQVVGSVVLVSFGSVIRNTMAQLVELGHGLEASGRPFIWVVKEVAERQVPGSEWVAEFEKRVEGRGIMIRGWAPQAAILGHEAVGGFVTHCGWNSMLEAVAMGVVMATWPHLYDQFLNELLAVEVLKIGVVVAVEEPKMFGAEKGDEVVVKVSRGDVERIVERLMVGGKEGEERRERAKELRDKARTAMEEGGSSWKGLQDVINYVSERQKIL
uniref:UDP-glycosyltransferase 73E1-like isoform X1 n=1 Tax=Cymbidium sinense TaxID=112615 RepID=A0A513X4Q8_9ASPA|nr:UDP-glycosyltransferase 73E1-like isoform X1 [Cymbidium sinense]